MTWHVVTDVQPARLMLHKRSGGRSGESVESMSLNRLTVTHGYIVVDETSRLWLDGFML